MNRDDWTVQYTGEQLLAAAVAKAKFHRGRKEWWLKAKEEAIAKVKSEGINVSESIVDELMKTGYTNAPAFGGGPKIQVDTALAARVHEAHNKVHEHANKIEEYDVWVQMLDKHINKTFELDNNDWMFFFGHTKPQDQ